MFFCQGHGSLPVNSLGLTAIPRPRLPGQGHILNAGGGALRVGS
jgi:hypothetical protein